MMKILFIADPMETFKTYKDTTYAMMREMTKRCWTLHHTRADQLMVKNGSVMAEITPFIFIGAINDDDHHWFQTEETIIANLNTFDAVIMRSDPPFNMQYLYATHLLSLAQAQGANVFNSGKAMREFNEKLSILRFPQWTPSTIVSTKSSQIRQFLSEHNDIIVKPLDGMGGMGIFRLRENDPNVGSILETLMDMDKRTIMAQKYLPEVVHGDKRILIIGGEVIPFALARIPQNGETRGNLAAGGKGVAIALSERDRAIAEDIAPKLMQEGILLAGLDVIGDYLTEINVTSPTCFQEISQQTGYDVSAHFADALVKAVSGRLTH